MKERYRFFKNGLLLSLVTIAIRTVAMLFSAFITRTVGAEGTGLYTIIMTVYSFALTVATSGISLTVTRLVASAIGKGSKSEAGRILRGAFTYSLIFGLFAGSCLYFGADLIGTRILHDSRSVASMKILSLSLLPSALIAVFTGYFVGVKRVGFNASAQVFSQLVKIVATVALVLWAAPFGIAASVSALCLGITLTELLSFLLMLAEYCYDRHKYAEKCKEKSSPDVKSVSKTAIPLALSLYVRSIFLTIEHILIPARLRDSGESSSDAYAQYGVLHGMALPLILYPMSPLSSFAGLLVPEFAEDMAGGNTSRMKRICSEAISTTLIYAVLSAVFIYFFSEELGYLVYGSYEAGKYIAILAPVIPIMYLDHVTDSVLKGIGEQVFSMWVNISDSVLSVLLVWFLIPKFGIGGYAIVIVVMEGYNFLLSVIRLGSKVKFKISIFRSVILPALAATLSAFLTKELFIFSGASSSVFWLVMKMIFFIALFFGAFYLLNIIRARNAPKIRAADELC